MSASVRDETDASVQGPEAFADEVESGVRLIAEPRALVEPFFVVLFECGGHLSFQHVLDALDCMKDFEGALATIRLPDRELIAEPEELDYSAIWNRKVDPQWRSL